MRNAVSMAARSGADYLAGLGTARKIWLDSERIEDVATDPRLGGAAHVRRRPSDE